MTGFCEGSKRRHGAAKQSLGPGCFQGCCYSGPCSQGDGSKGQQSIRDTASDACAKEGDCGSRTSNAIALGTTCSGVEVQRSDPKTRVPRPTRRGGTNGAVRRTLLGLQLPSGASPAPAPFARADGQLTFVELRRSCLGLLQLSHQPRATQLTVAWPSRPSSCRTVSKTVASDLISLSIFWIA